MTRDVLVCSIISVNIKRTFSIIRKVCCCDRAQMNSETVNEFMIVKYYNCKTNRTKNNSFIES